MLKPKEHSLVILTDGYLDNHKSKTAHGVIRYGDWDIKCVIDGSKHIGKAVNEVIGYGADITIVENIEQALQLEPTVLMLGNAPQGGELPVAWRKIILKAIESGLHIMSGLHTFIGKDLQFQAAAREYNTILWDVRDPDLIFEHKYPINRHISRPDNTKVITMIGTDCSIGKMYAALELNQAFNDANISSEFLATGQTGMMITCDGLPLDRIISDFAAGALEQKILELIAKTNTNWIFVEGQGSLYHPAYSAVTMGLLHGSNPDAMVLCLKADHKYIRSDYASSGTYDVKIPDIYQVIQDYERVVNLARPSSLKPTQVVALSVNTMDIKDDTHAQTYIGDLEKQTGLPVTDPLRFGVQKLMEKICAIEL